MDIRIEETKFNQAVKGFVKIWKSDPTTGASKLILDKKNTILYQGMDLLAYAITGQPNASISHFYVAYNNNASFTGAATPVNKSDPSFTAGGDYGYLRVPLTYPAAFLKDTGYDHNIPVFTILLSDANSLKVAGSPTFGSSSKIYELGLVAALDTGSDAQDQVFARLQFDPIDYDPTHNLTISWGVKFTA